jgi:hypothetical protein
MAQEAKASGKARGYADMGPAVRKVESQSDEREESTARAERPDE